MVTILFDEVALEDAHYTYKALADKFDGVNIRDALASLSLMEEYIRENLEDSGYNKNECKKIARNIVRGFKTHDEVINSDKAKKLGLKIVTPSDFGKGWALFREWLAIDMLQGSDKHIIWFVISENSIPNGKTENKSKKMPKWSSAEKLFKQNRNTSICLERRENCHNKRDQLITKWTAHIEKSTKKTRDYSILEK